MGSPALEFGYVPPPFSDAVRVAVFGLLDAPLRAGGGDWEDASEHLADGRAQLWLTIEDGKPIAAMVTCIDGDTLEVWLAGGAVLRTPVQFLERVIEASKAAGTTNGRITGRKGWARVLRRYGWRQDGEDLVKDWA